MNPKDFGDPLTFYQTPPTNVSISKVTKIRLEMFRDEYSKMLKATP